MTDLTLSDHDYIITINCVGNEGLILLIGSFLEHHTKSLTQYSLTPANQPWDWIPATKQNNSRHVCLLVGNESATRQRLCFVLVCAQLLFLFSRLLNIQLQDNVSIFSFQTSWVLFVEVYRQKAFLRYFFFFLMLVFVTLRPPTAFITLCFSLSE